MIRTKRAYDDIAPGDGMRVLVDRLWPRGKKKEELKISGWYKELAPSKELRLRFHSSLDWPEFKRLYFNELDQKRKALEPFINRASEADITLIYGSRDRKHNNAIALKEYLENKLGKPS